MSNQKYILKEQCGFGPLRHPETLWVGAIPLFPFCFSLMGFMIFINMKENEGYGIRISFLYRPSSPLWNHKAPSFVISAKILQAFLVLRLSCHLISSTVTYPLVYYRHTKAPIWVGACPYSPVHSEPPNGPLAVMHASRRNFRFPCMDQDVCQWHVQHFKAVPYVILITSLTETIDISCQGLRLTVKDTRSSHLIFHNILSILLTSHVVFKPHLFKISKIKKQGFSLICTNELHLRISSKVSFFKCTTGDQNL